MVATILQSTPFRSHAEEWHKAIEERLNLQIPTFTHRFDLQWQEAINTAVFNGGKRLRPLLAILGWQVTNIRLEDARTQVLDFAAAIEFIHCSSLIFDDLPCMDNATLRRGKVALHLKYGEDKAILVALGLLLKGIEIIFKVGTKISDPSRYHMLMGQLMAAIGSTGLICGQWFDLSTKQSDMAKFDRQELLALRNLKTMPLIKYSLLGGAILGGSSDDEWISLSRFAELIGDSYQIVDDILDLIADSKFSGKDAAIDLRNDRLNSAYQGPEVLINNLRNVLSEARNIASTNFVILEDADNLRARAALHDFPDYLYGQLQEAYSG